MKGLAGLDQRVQEIEQRLIDREDGLRRRMRSLRLRLANEPRRLIGPLLLAASAFVAIFLLAGRRRGSRSVPGRSLAGRGASVMHYGGLLWPLLPSAWRARMKPFTAIPLAGLLAPLIDQAFPAQKSLPPLSSVSHVDLDRYAGHWHEVARLSAPFESACKGQPEADYLVRTRGAAKHGPLYFDVVNHCPDAKGRKKQVEGVAVPVAGSGGARLQVSFWPSWLRWLPGAWADYWILHLDDDYTEALVGEPRRRFMWVLSRSATMAPERLNALLSLAHQKGFDVTRVVYPGR